MDCPRLRHYVRLNVNGSIGRCGHMVKMKHFDSLERLEQSNWLKSLKEKFSQGVWPDECSRCKLSEEMGLPSVRLDMIKKDKILKKIRQDYLVVGGVLDNVCNSACISCNDKLSTKIGSLHKKNYFQIDNTEQFNKLPKDRICEIDISGGEPTASRRYKALLLDLPGNVKVVRINTNCSLFFKEIENLLEKQIKTILTVSLDGIGLVHDYMRWPVSFDHFEKNLKLYMELQKKYKNFSINTWTTVSGLNLHNLEQIFAYVKHKKLKHDFGLVSIPEVLDVRYKNKFTEKFKKEQFESKDKILKGIAEKCCTLRNNQEELDNFIDIQNSLRGIKIQDYFSLCPQTENNLSAKDI